MQTTEANKADRATKLNSNGTLLPEDKLHELVTKKYSSPTIRLAYISIALSCDRNVFYLDRKEFIPAFFELTETPDYKLPLKHLNDSSDVIAAICKYGIRVRSDAKTIVEKAIAKRKEAARIIDSILHRAPDIEVPLKWVHYMDKKVVLLSKKLQPMTMVRLADTSLTGVIKKCQLMLELADVELTFSVEKCPYDVPEKTVAKRMSGKRVVLLLAMGRTQSAAVNWAVETFTLHLSSALKQQGIDLSLCSGEIEDSKHDFLINFEVGAVDTLAYYSNNDASKAVGEKLDIEEKIVDHSKRKEASPSIDLILSFPYIDDHRITTSKIDNCVTEIASSIATAIL